MATTVESLPSEILQQVAAHLHDDINNIRECSLVCVNWKRLYQKPLYSTIRLQDFSQSRKLLRTLKRNPQLSGLVEQISFVFELDYENRAENSTIATLFTYVPHLERVDFSQSSGLKFLLDALVAKKLPYLNRVEPPYEEEDIVDYTKCAFILRNRLKNLSIVDPAAEEEEYSDDDEEAITFRNQGCALFHRLYDKLDEFQNINELQLKTKSSNDMRLLEEVTKSCPLLERLDVDLSPANETNPAISSLNNIAPALKIRYLKFRKGMLYHPVFTAYIASKFPSLNSLVIFGQTDRNAHLNSLEFRKFLDYLSTINNVNIQGMSFDSHSLVDTVGLFWETMTISRTMSVEFRYSESNYPSMDEISVKIDDSHISNVIRYQQSTNDLNYLNYITNYGQHITSLAVFKAPGSSSGTTLWDSLVIQPLKYCVKLKRLALLGCNLTSMNVSNNGLARRTNFESLSFLACAIENSAMFESLTKLFASIKHLELYAFRYTNRPKKSSSINIHLKETDIGDLALSTNTFFSNGRRDHKLLVKLTTERSRDYFMYDIVSTNELILKRMDHQEFEFLLQNSKNFMIDLNFKSIIFVSIEHFERKLMVPVELPA